MGVPDGRSVANCDLVATTVNADDYMHTELTIVIQKNHMEQEFAGVHAPLDETRRKKRVYAQNLVIVSTKAPRGQATEQELENVKPNAITFIDASVYEQIGKVKISSVLLPYYIDPTTSQLARNYIIDEEPADASVTTEKVKLVDDIFHGWLIAHDMGCDDFGVVHRRTKEGKLTEVVPAEEVRRLLEDPEMGIEAKAKQMMPDVEFVLFWTPPELQEYAAQQAQAGTEGQKQSR